MCGNWKLFYWQNLLDGKKITKVLFGQSASIDFLLLM